MKKKQKINRKLILAVGVLAVTFAILGGIVNIWHWYNIGDISWEDPTSYQYYVPIFGLLSWIAIVSVYRYLKIKNIFLWLVAFFWILYDTILFFMVNGWL